MFYLFLSFFMLGAIFGSFFYVVAYRIPKGESIVYPPSHCPNCNHRLGPLELVPIFSYLLQFGKCKNCRCKISIFYPMFEIICGVLFGLSYLSYGFSLDLVIVLTFVSMISIIVLSDIYYMIISDGVLLFFSICLFMVLNMRLLIYYMVVFRFLLCILLSYLAIFCLRRSQWVVAT